METRILIADEDGAVRRMIARVLDVAGYAAIQAATAPELAARLAVIEPALLLVDLEMLDRDGREVSDQLRRHLARLPLIGMTALPHQRQTALRWGADSLMEKPLDLTFLLLTVQELLTKCAPTARGGAEDRPPAVPLAGTGARHQA